MAIQGNLQQGAARKPASALGWSMTGLAVLGIWAGVFLATLLAPDFVSGSQQEHLQLVQWTEWIWGLAATASVIAVARKGLRRGVETVGAWLVLGVGSAVIWLGVAAVTVLAPVMVTGSDPTRIPLAALGAPLAGLVLTHFLANLVRDEFED